MSERRLRQIRQRCEAATPGPWVYFDNGFDGYIQTANTSEYIVGGERHEGRIEPGDPNAAFIAHSREDIPWLVETLEQAQARVRELEAENQRLRLAFTYITYDGTAGTLPQEFERVLLLQVGCIHGEEVIACRDDVIFYDDGCTEHSWDCGNGSYPDIQIGDRWHYLPIPERRKEQKDIQK